MLLEENVFRLTVTVRLQKSYWFKTFEFCFTFSQSISYNNVLDTQKIYFASTFLKSWVHISYNIALVVGGPKYYQRRYRYRERKGNLFFCPIII